MLVFELGNRNHIEWFMKEPLPNISVSEIEAIQADDEELDILLCFMAGNDDSVQTFEGSEVLEIWKELGGEL